MRRALALARRGLGKTAPNPAVGCVLARRGRVVGEGWHRGWGLPHAEPQALRQAGPRARGATAYVTLEPCCAHPGKKTPPCAPALIEAGVARVVAAVRDPNPAVRGKGLAQLRRHGIQASSGLLARQAAALNAAFFSRMSRRKPHVILKAALSADGRAYAEGGRSKWITAPAARRLARRLRAACDAVLVGSGTVLADDPRLTGSAAGRDPIRVILDARLRTPASARVLRGGAPTLIFSAVAGRRGGAEVLRVRRAREGVDLRQVLAELARRGVGSLLVEGGPTVQASFLRAGLVDEARVFIAPKLLGGALSPNSAPRLRAMKVQRVGSDILLSGKVR